jgi:phenylpropionate dioxygenase-like ring-hydroxylating dioxygenase large terminal subunit
MNDIPGDIPLSRLRRAEPGPDDFVDKADYVDAGFAAIERERLWPRAWQMACREEEVPRVGDYVTYDILGESIIVIRTAPDRVSAFHKACQHRGRRLTEGCGHAARLFCKFHGWTWNIDGTIARVVDRENWGGTLEDEDIALPKVRVDSWGGWVFVCPSEETEPLLDWLAPIPQVFRNYPFERMRYRWRKSTGIACNWKTALEAFDEGYHVQTTHRQLLPVHDDDTIAYAEGRHGSYSLAPHRLALGERSPRLGPQKVDYRQNLHDFVLMLERDLKASIPPHMSEVTHRLLFELPEEASLLDVLIKYGALAHEAATAQGIAYPSLTPEEMARAGADWHLFPNMVFLPSPDALLAYRARPDPRDPERCIFEIYSLLLYPNDQAPAVELQDFADWTDHDGWGLILEQDFQNMTEVQRGMRSSGFRRSRLNPVQEKSVANFHRALHDFVDLAPQEKDKTWAD